MIVRRTMMMVIVATIAPGGAPLGAERSLEPFRIIGDAVPEPLAGQRGDPMRGEQIVLDRETGNCLICHAVPDPKHSFQGDIGPPLTGVGSRLSEGQIRLRLIDQSLVNENTVMPPNYRIAGLANVAPTHLGKPALTAQQIDDVAAYLASLRD